MLTQSNDNNDKSNNNYEINSQSHEHFDNNSPQSVEQFNPKDELLKHDMMKKLSLKEQWLHDNQVLAAKNAKSVPMEVDDKIVETKSKDDKKSFLNGIFKGITHLIKPSDEKNAKEKSKSPKKKSKSKTPPNVEDKVEVFKVEVHKVVEYEKPDLINVAESFEELLANEKPQQGNTNKKMQAFLQRQRSDEVREEADEILNDIKEGQDKMAKQMRDMEQRRFSDNMNAIKSNIVDQKVASMKEVNLSKYFPNQQEKKPPAVAKNKDVKALKDVNLSKYFPSSPTTGRKNMPGSPTGQSTPPSTPASPLTPRKNVNEIDLANYFPGTPLLSRKPSVSTPPSSPLTENAPSFSERRESINIVMHSSIAPPPPPPIAKKNILSLQTVKKKVSPIPVAVANEINNANIGRKSFKSYPTKMEEPLLKPESRKSSLKDNDLNMFDQLLDGAIDLKMLDDNIDCLISEVRLERSPSKEYARIFDDGPKEKKKDKKSKKNSTELEGKEPDVLLEVKKKKSKSKSKSPKNQEEDNGMLGKLSIDPKIFQNLTNEYQRLLNELNGSMSPPETETEEHANVIEIPKRIPPSEIKDVKRKSPERFDDRKKFKEEEIDKLEEVVPIEEDSVLSRLQKKYKRNSVVTAESVAEKLPESPEEESNPIVSTPPKLSIIERMEQKLKQKLIFDEDIPVMLGFKKEKKPLNEQPILNSVKLVKEQCKIQDEFKTFSEVKEGLKPLKEINGKPPRKETTTRVPKDEKYYEPFMALPKEGINDIFTELEVLKKESSPKKVSSETRKQKKEDDFLASLISLPKESVNEVMYDIKSTKKDSKKNKESPEKKKEKSSPPKESKKQSKVKEDIIDEILDVKSTKMQEKRNSLKLELAQIDLGISERPFDMQNLIPRKNSIDESIGISESPKSFASLDDLKNRRSMSAKDSAYSDEMYSNRTSRKSSATEQEIRESFKDTNVRNEDIYCERHSKKYTASDRTIKESKEAKEVTARSHEMYCDKHSKKSSAAEHELKKDFNKYNSNSDDIYCAKHSKKQLSSEKQMKEPSKDAYEAVTKTPKETKKLDLKNAEYINMLKDISCGLVGFNDELVTMESPEILKIPVKSVATKKESYSDALKEISSGLVGSEVYGMELEKRFAQMIPPIVERVTPERIVPKTNLKKVSSENSFEVPNIEKTKEYHPVNGVVHNQIPVPPTRRHRSMSQSRTPEPPIRSRKPMIPSKSFDNESMSGRGSKASEYYEYPMSSSYQVKSKRDLNPYNVPVPTRNHSVLDKYDLHVSPRHLTDYRSNYQRPRAIDNYDLMVRPAVSRIYQQEEVPIRRPEYRRKTEETDESESILERSQQLHQKKENFMRDQINEKNPYIREMMKQDVDNPIDISDIKYIRRHQAAPVSATTSSYLSSHSRPITSFERPTYDRPISYERPSARTPTNYAKSSPLSHIPGTSAYSRPIPNSSMSSYKSTVPKTSNLSYLSPSSSTAAKILTKSHLTQSHLPHTYMSRNKNVSHLTDNPTSSTSSSRFLGNLRSGSSSNSHKKNAGSKESCQIS